MIASKIDPSEEQREMIKSLQRSFYDKISTREADLEKAKSQKFKPGTYDEITKHIKNLRSHYEKLEHLLRFIENNPVTLEQLWPLTDKLQNYLKTDDTEDLEAELEQKYKDFNLPISKIMSNFPALNEEDQEVKKVLGKKLETKQMPSVVIKSESKPVEKGWNTKEALMKIAGKVEKVVEDIQDDEEEPEKIDLDWSKKQIDFAFNYPIRNDESAKSSLQMVLTPYPGHPSYPKKPMINPGLFSKFDLDTLFFIFYHQHGTYQQFLAAKELKAQGWIYHKKFQTWFQRSGEPKLTAQDREKGTFLYFDYETSWSQRRKADFEFEYSFLENDLL
ncbi:hypothetical protein SteCoe_25327 [Stentor coeruleus]|uniref:NOT2/NOT3/NOT5 C-terminal domain-containing protein n=1 Tax=Stentor coeruleus TaxID=5963 RepID=A0A1R2BFF8_9CILI|nr:hypothetical protein SteCoe_25327 [Stentor coeruleus]